MRLWSLHPKYLDARGLVALWRETLLAQEVLRGSTKGYRHHPQLERFRAHSAPLTAMSLYLESIYAEALTRGYAFDRRKFRSTRRQIAIRVTKGQLRHEWVHLQRKLRQRSPATFKKWVSQGVSTPHAHPLFRICAGPVEPWERSSRLSRRPGPGDASERMRAKVRGAGRRAAL
jgi:Pyrimidine dimer DNA glycosylase